MVQHIMPPILAILSVLIVAAIMVQAQPKGGLIAKPELDPSCISHYDYCRFSLKPCCGRGKRSIMGGSSGEEYTCSVFDSGRCEPTNSFKNIKKHLELVEKLNDTNFEELRREYFRDLQRVEEHRTTDELISGPPCIRNHDYCRFSVRPCCDHELSMQGVWIGEEHTCSMFDSGRCEPTNSFKNIHNLLVMIDRLDDNNFDELRIEYFRDLQRVEKERNEDKLKAEPACIAYNDYCRFSLTPCCDHGLSTQGAWMSEEHTCSVFDSGRCEPTKSFVNIEKHLELVKKLNDTNFEELRKEYFTDLQRVQRRLTEAKPTVNPLGAVRKFESDEQERAREWAISVEVIEDDEEKKFHYEIPISNAITGSGSQNKGSLFLNCFVILNQFVYYFLPFTLTNRSVCWMSI
uniref:FHv1.4 cys-motif protein n=1 Tax=Campoletis sonorensis ichnovirus TaxID=10484 RepID=Q80PW5_CSIV|nr:FHv1.4 cys-motif protein precursor [Ichnoviriform sonorense]